MDDDAKYGPLWKAMSGADSVQARRFAAGKALEICWGGVSKVSAIIQHYADCKNWHYRIYKMITVISYISRLLKK
jgi:hypothetical protein